MGRRTHGKTTEIVLAEIRNYWGDHYIYDKFVYVNSGTKVIIQCKEHGYFEKYPNDIKNGGGCPKCRGGVKYTHEEFVEKVHNLFDDIIVLDNYIDANTTMSFKCTLHDIAWKAKPKDILQNHRNCSQCSYDKFISTKVAKGQIRHPDELPQFEKYKREVWKITNRTYKEHLSEYTRDSQNHLDHKLSILEGFIQCVDPLLIGSIHNLQMLSGKANRKKSYKSSITITQLQELNKL